VEWLPRAQAAARRTCRVHANGRRTVTRTAAPCAADALFSGLEGYRAEGAEPVEESQRSMPSLPCAACALLSARIMQLAPCAHVDVCPGVTAPDGAGFSGSGAPSVDRRYSDGATCTRCRRAAGAEVSVLRSGGASSSRGSTYFGDTEW
jgi:hypothetical protein